MNNNNNESAIRNILVRNGLYQPVPGPLRATLHKKKAPQLRSILREQGKGGIITSIAVSVYFAMKHHGYPLQMKQARTATWIIIVTALCAMAGGIYMILYHYL